MGKRREGREAAVQFLFQLDLRGEKQPSDAADFWELRAGPGKAPADAKTRAFAETLVAGVAAHAGEIDERIKSCTANYEVSRIAAVDRNILRVAIYELLHGDDVAPAIVINEAIEIAKKFGTEKSGGFVNGILDRIRKERDEMGRGMGAAGSEQGSGISSRKSGGRSQESAVGNQESAVTRQN